MMLILILRFYASVFKEWIFWRCKYKSHNLNWITNPHCQWLCQSNDRPWPRLAASFSKATLNGDIWCSHSDDEGRAVPHFHGEGEKVHLHRGNFLNFSSTLCDVPESGVWIEDQQCSVQRLWSLRWEAVVCTPHDDFCVAFWGCWPRLIGGILVSPEPD